MRTAASAGRASHTAATSARCPSYSTTGESGSDTQAGVASTSTVSPAAAARRHHGSDQRGDGPGDHKRDSDQATPMSRPGTATGISRRIAQM